MSDPPKTSMDEELASLETLEKIRKYVVYAAIALLVLSLVKYVAPLVYVRSALWAAAGVVTVMFGLKLKKLGQSTGNTWINAALYFGVALLPLYFRR